MYDDVNSILLFLLLALLFFELVFWLAFAFVPSQLLQVKLGDLWGLQAFARVQSVSRRRTSPMEAARGSFLEPVMK